MSDQRPIPEWVNRGKTIRQLIEELRSFSNQDLEVRVSLDFGETHHPISIVAKHDDRFCVLINAEDYFRNGWQDFMDRRDVETGRKSGRGSGEDDGISTAEHEA